jgi:5-methylcytosine-specific restriction endonuclease McrA
MAAERKLREIFDKTSGHCHLCGDPILFENRGRAPSMEGHWEVDHVIQRDKGGSVSVENCLPACTRCNRLRWHRTGEGIREVLWLGTIAVKEIKRGTPIGRELERLRQKRTEENSRWRLVRKARARAAVAY